MVFKHIKHYGEHEQIVYFNNPLVNLKGIIAIHSRTMGPALGGCRMYPYLSEEDALLDVLKLSRSMTYKAALADLPLGGGKAVIIGNSTLKTPELFKAFGDIVHSLNGSYITAEDLGTSTKDMQYINSSTPFVTGLSEEAGGSGDPSIYTAQSTLVGIKAAVFYKLKKQSLTGLKVSIQGLGHVGIILAKLLLKEGCILNICDIKDQKVLDFKKKYSTINHIPHEQIYDADCDVFSPCALGGILNPKILDRLKCSIIAGSANNQLNTLNTEVEICKKNILYVPDFVLNAGGLINVFTEYKKKYSKSYTQQKINNIYNVLMQIFKLAEQKKQNPTNIAIDIASKKINNKKMDNGENK